MALIIFLRGLNVGGHRTFRPSSLAKELAAYDVVNVGAAGTFVVRKPGSRRQLMAEMRRHLPFETQIACCDSVDLLKLEASDPFIAEPSHPDLVHFVSILAKTSRRKVSLPVTLPADRDWFIRILGSRGRLIFGSYRRHMKTISYLGQLDKLFGATATTRSWTTILSILRLVKN